MPSELKVWGERRDEKRDRGERERGIEGEEGKIKGGERGVRGGGGGGERSG